MPSTTQKERIEQLSLDPELNVLHMALVREGQLPDSIFWDCVV